jgi:hypothetical protein
MRTPCAAALLLLFPLALFTQEPRKDASLEAALMNAYTANLNVEGKGKPFAAANTISAAWLESINWYLSPWLMADGNETLTFSKGAFIIRAKHVGTIAYGTYKLGTGNAIELHIANWSDSTADMLKDLGFQKNVVIVNYVNDPSNFRYQSRISLGKPGVDFYATDSWTPDGGTYKLDGYDTEKLAYGSTGVANGRLNVRSIPSVTGAKTMTLDNKQVIDLKGRTAAKFTVDGIEDSWYYVAIYDLEYVDHGWVFGGYLKDIKIAPVSR